LRKQLGRCQALSARLVTLGFVGIFDPLDYRDRTPEELNGPALLSEVLELTSGRGFHVENVNELPDIAAKIGAKVRNQSILGYRPSNKSHDARRFGARGKTLSNWRESLHAAAVTNGGERSWISETMSLSDDRHRPTTLTECTGYIGNTSGPNGLSIGSKTRVSRSKYPRS
jgi:hypothetical protein